ncbi:hypothetical protein RN22_02020 [Grimontia sp. AD028]|uniref:YccT family protein n=1 Tax=Grimontia sp. AD028 TaxID=1581149 RepID=UPI00061A9664|nr:DUF2057 family protein [Grimontia sp. AD028]KKD62118.1 hypothetical protein RN22_02020 [Grimontia sp. AD028]
MLKKSVLAITVLGISTSVFADVSVKIPNGVQVLVENGNETNFSNLGFDSKDTVIFPNGNNQLVFRLSHIVQESGSKKTKYKSVPMIATFTANDTTLNLKINKRITTLDEGRTFNKKPNFTIEDNGSPIEVKSDVLPVGFDLMTDFSALMRTYNEGDHLASWKLEDDFSVVQKKTPVQMNNLDTSTFSSTTENSGNVESEQMLKFWFSQASSQEQKNFLSWAIQNVKQQ